MASGRCRTADRPFQSRIGFGCNLRRHPGNIRSDLNGCIQHEKPIGRRYIGKRTDDFQCDSEVTEKYQCLPRQQLDRKKQVDRQGKDAENDAHLRRSLPQVADNQITATHLMGCLVLGRSVR